MFEETPNGIFEFCKREGSGLAYNSVVERANNRASAMSGNGEFWKLTSGVLGSQL
jgi:hypothetical protein